MVITWPLLQLCTFAMKGCICVGLANYVFLLRRIGGRTWIFINNPARQINLPWYVKLGRCGLANFICNLRAITPSFGLQMNPHLVYSLVLQWSILEYGYALIASSMYTSPYVYLHLITCAIAQHRASYMVGPYKIFVRWIFQVSLSAYGMDVCAGFSPPSLWNVPWYIIAHISTHLDHICWCV